MTMSTNARVLIVERTVGDVSDHACLGALPRHGYQALRVPHGTDPVPVIEQEGPLVVCFHFDHPDLTGLAELGLTKETVPSVPLIMITRAHSEALAIWAFRTRVWDYFVEPVDQRRFLAVLGALAALRNGASKSRTPVNRLSALPNPIPPEARVRGHNPPVSQAKLELARSYVEQNLHRKIVLAEVAEQCGLSPFQLSRAFTRQFAVTFQEYVLRQRIASAMRLLSHPEASVTDVCFSVGFHDVSYFTRTFQRFAGTTPSAFRMSRRGHNSAAGAPPVTPQQAELDLQLVDEQEHSGATRPALRDEFA